MPQYDDWDAERYIASINPRRGSKPKYQLLFEVLSDQQFHCRECANRVVNSNQIAGSMVRFSAPSSSKTSGAYG